MWCLFSVHQLIFMEDLSSTWHWELRDRKCDKCAVSLTALELWGAVIKGEQCVLWDQRGHAVPNTEGTDK